MLVATDTSSVTGANEASYALPNAQADAAANAIAHAAAIVLANSQPDTNARHYQLVRRQGGWALQLADAGAGRKVFLVRRPQGATPDYALWRVHHHR